MLLLVFVFYPSLFHTSLIRDYNSYFVFGFYKCDIRGYIIKEWTMVLFKKALHQLYHPFIEKFPAVWIYIKNIFGCSRLKSRRAFSDMAFFFVFSSYSGYTIQKWNAVLEANKSFHGKHTNNINDSRNFFQQPSRKYKIIGKQKIRNILWVVGEICKNYPRDFDRFHLSRIVVLFFFQDLYISIARITFILKVHLQSQPST